MINIRRSIRLSMTVLMFTTMAAGMSIAGGQDDIVGSWYNGEKDAQIEIYKCGENYCGKIVWLKDPNYPEGSKDGAPGTPKIDHHNPDPARQKDPILGLKIVHGFHYAGEGLWTDGKVYDPKNGKTYSGKMTLRSPQQLDLRGYIGISLIGRTTTWTR